MKKLFSLSVFTLVVFTAFAQVTFEKYPVPAGTDNSNYRLAADYYSDKQILFPVDYADSLYARNAAGEDLQSISFGLYITAFYADNGDLYLVENADTNGFEPHLYKSVNNGGTFTEITGVAGRVFHRDQYGNLFYSVPGGFAFSTDDGVNFTSVFTPDTVYSAARNETGILYFIDDSDKLFRSGDNGANWTQAPGQYDIGAYADKRIWAVSDTVYYHSGSYFGFTTVNDTQWRNIQLPFTSIIVNAHLSEDGMFFSLSPYGFYSSDSHPSAGSWNQLVQQLYVSLPSEIYPNTIVVSDSAMYCHTDTGGYIYAPRAPNITSIAEAQLNETTVTVFPNPASGQLRISASRAHEDFLLLNVSGQTILKEHIASREHTIDISAFEPGVYVWRMGNSSGKILVE